MSGLPAGSWTAVKPARRRHGGSSRRSSELAVSDGERSAGSSAGSVIDNADADGGMEDLSSSLPTGRDLPAMLNAASAAGAAGASSGATSADQQQHQQQRRLQEQGEQVPPLQHILQQQPPPPLPLNSRQDSIARAAAQSLADLAAFRGGGQVLRSSKSDLAQLHTHRGGGGGGAGPGSGRGPGASLPEVVHEGGPAPAAVAAAPTAASGPGEPALR